MRALVPGSHQHPDSSEVKRYERQIHDESPDEYVATFIEGTTWSAFRNVYLAPLLAKLRNAKLSRVLDLGCGPKPVHAGAIGGYVGVDISPESIRAAREKYPGRDFVIADAENLPFKSQRFDGVLCFGSLHHLPNPLDCLAEIRRCLAHGGFYIGYEPNVKASRLNFMHLLARTRLGRLISALFYRTSKTGDQAGPIHSKYEKELSRSEVVDLFKDWRNVRIRGAWLLDLMVPSRVPKEIALPLQTTIFKIDRILARHGRLQKLGSVHTVQCVRP